MRFGSKIAIVGMGGVFPGAERGVMLRGFGGMVVAGRSAAREVPAGRWPGRVEEVFSDGSGVEADKVYSKRGCFVEGFELMWRG